MKLNLLITLGAITLSITNLVAETRILSASEQVLSKYADNMNREWDVRRVIPKADQVDIDRRLGDLDTQLKELKKNDPYYSVKKKSILSNYDIIIEVFSKDKVEKSKVKLVISKGKIHIDRHYTNGVMGHENIFISDDGLALIFNHRTKEVKLSDQPLEVFSEVMKGSLPETIISDSLIKNAKSVKREAIVEYTSTDNVMRTLYKWSIDIQNKSLLSYEKSYSGKLVERVKVENDLSIFELFLTKPAPLFTETWKLTKELMNGNRSLDYKNGLTDSFKMAEKGYRWEAQIGNSLTKNLSKDDIFAIFYKK